mgnify:CR=1 FL=1
MKLFWLKATVLIVIKNVQKEVLNMWKQIGEIIVVSVIELILILLIPFVVVYAVLAGLLDLCITFFDTMKTYFEEIKDGF